MLFKNDDLLNLQLFAEGDDDGGEQGDKPTPEFTPPASQSELDALINKSNQKALENNNKDWQAKLPDLINEELAKKKSYEDLSDEDKEKQKITDAWQEIEDAKRETKQKELLFAVRGDLIEKGLPSKVGEFDFAELFVASGDSEQALESVKAFEQAFAKGIEEAVDKRLASSVRIPGGDGNSATVTASESLAKQRNEQSKPSKSLWP